MDTIFALSTPLGNGVAVIRISGPGALDALKRGFSHMGEYTPNLLYYGSVLGEGGVIDKGMAVYLAGPRSYTGEDCGELHIHGSQAVAQAALDMLSGLGLRLAEPGEFTKRAFLNGRMELSQAESVMDLIHSRTQAEAKAALSQLEGSVGKAVIALQDALTDAIAQLEAAIDYPQEDWEGDAAAAAEPFIQEVQEGLGALLASSRQGRLVREGLKLALCGSPNVGKSTLLNALTGADRAIVTDIPGTTRDVLEEGLSWEGLPVVLMDTAGLRDSADPVERIGVERARKAMAQADLVLYLLDGGRPLSREDRRALEGLGDREALVLLNKSDLSLVLDSVQLAAEFGKKTLLISAQKGTGLEELRIAVKEYYDRLSPQAPPPAVVTNRRHIDALKAAFEAVLCARKAITAYDLDCATIDLRDAWRSLGLITGLTVDQAIIDRIFQRFCLGK